MKIRIASVMLAFGLTLSAATVAFASETGEVTGILQETQEQTEQTAQFYLDGEPLYGVVAESINGTYYVTLSSMLPLIDSSAIVEENSGAAAVTAQAVVVEESTPEETPGLDGQIDVPETLQGEEAQTGDVLTTFRALEMGAKLLASPLENEIQTESDAEAEPTPEAVVEVVDTLTLSAMAGEQYVVANGRYLYVEDGVITLDGAVAVPVRVLAKAMNMTTMYDAQTGLVYLTSSEEIGYLEDGDTYYNSDSLYWLSRIIYCESGNQVLNGKIAVGNVVLNRVKDSRSMMSSSRRISLALLPADPSTGIPTRPASLLPNWYWMALWCWRMPCSSIGRAWYATHLRTGPISLPSVGTPFMRENVESQGSGNTAPLCVFDRKEGRDFLK